MRQKSILLIATALLVLIGIGAGVWISVAPIAPPEKTVTEAIPDDHIPH
jgi:hypothetical protein